MASGGVEREVRAGMIAFVPQDGLWVKDLTIGDAVNVAGARKFKETTFFSVEPVERIPARMRRFTLFRAMGSKIPGLAQVVGTGTLRTMRCFFRTKAACRSSRRRTIGEAPRRRSWMPHYPPHSVPIAPKLSIPTM